MLTAPRNIGGIEDFRIMVDQLTEVKALRILGVHRTTLRRWLGGYAKVPRHAVLALYWETHWGRAQIDSDRQYVIHLLNQQITFLRKENNRLVAALQEMEKYGDHETANFPVFKFATSKDTDPLF